MPAPTPPPLIPPSPRDVVVPAWEDVCSCVTKESDDDQTPEGVVISMSTLRTHSYDRLLVDWYFDEYLRERLEEVSRVFWSELSPFGEGEHHKGKKWVPKTFTKEILRVQSAIEALKRQVLKFARITSEAVNFDEVAGAKMQMNDPLSYLEPQYAYAIRFPSKEDTESRLLSRFRLAVHGAFFNDTPSYFDEFLEDYFTQAFKYFSKFLQTKKKTGAVQHVLDVSRCLSELQWVEIVEPVLYRTMFGKVHARIAEDCSPFANGFEQPGVLDSILTWLMDYVLDFVKNFYSEKSSSYTVRDPKSTTTLQSHRSSSALQGASSPMSMMDEDDGEASFFAIGSAGCSNFHDRESNSPVQQWHDRLVFFTHEHFAQVRCERLIEIIEEFPESEETIKDLAQCIRYTGSRDIFIETLKRESKERMFHIGAATKAIMNMFIKIVMALQTIDPSGVILEAVGVPIQNYLVQRTDAIKTMIQILAEAAKESDEFGEAQPGIYRELQNERFHRNVDLNLFGDDSDAESVDDPSQWEPDPIETTSGRPTLKRQTQDFFAFFVNMFGSKEKFIQEFRAELARELLNKEPRDGQDPEKFNYYHIDDQIQNVELLKIRFGDKPMQNCEVMVQDVSDSNRLNKLIGVRLKEEYREQKPDESRSEVDTLVPHILSAEFWPEFLKKQDKDEVPFVKPPSSIQALLDDFEAQYHFMKKARKLHWKPNLGSVDLDLELGSPPQIASMKVSPLCATVLSFFLEDKEEHGACRPISVSQVLEAAGDTEERIQRQISFWVKRGVLRPSIQSESSSSSSAASSASSSVVFQYTLVEGDEAERAAFEKISKLRYEERLEEETDADDSDAKDAALNPLDANLELVEAYLLSVFSKHESLTMRKIFEELKAMNAPELGELVRTLPDLHRYLVKLMMKKRVILKEGRFQLNL